MTKAGGSWGKCRRVGDCGYNTCDGQVLCKNGECICEPFGFGDGDGHGNGKKVVDGEGLPVEHCRTVADCRTFMCTTRLICDKGRCNCTKSVGGWGHFGHENVKKSSEEHPI